MNMTDPALRSGAARGSGGTASRSAPVLALLLLSAALCVPPACAQTSVLFDFESGSVAGWEHWSYGSDVTIETGIVRGGTNAMRYTHVQGESRYATAWEQPPTNDWSGFNKVSYWARSSVDTDRNTVKMQIKEGSGEEWIQKVETVLDTTYQRIEADLSSVETSGFEVASGVNWVLDLSQIVEVKLVFDSHVSNPYNPPLTPYSLYYYIDDIELSYDAPPQVADITLSTNLAAFGTVHASPSDHRFVSTAVYVQYTVSGYTDPWRIELYSTHAGGGMGLVGAVRTNFVLPLKCWYGPDSASAPDPEDNGNWLNGWSYVTDETNAWRPTLAASTNSPLDSGFQVRFATDAVGTYTQAYAAPVTVDLIIE